MRAVDIIIKKRDHFELSKEEIEFFVKGLTSGDIPDYQVASWAMAVLLNGMNERETADLTLAMAYSGDTLDLTKVVPIAVDKHSTGGVGDKTSLVVVPIVASCGVPVGKMSGRGLGFSGGTLDKLDSIPGFRSDLTLEEFLEQLKNVGLVLTGQTADLAPADGILYSLRDVTGTVPSFPLIASSVMSKKIAAGAHAIVLDVKTGYGAFMKNQEDATRLSQIMVAIGKRIGRSVVALISDMNQPLGCAVGNALELKEAIETLNGKGPDDFREHCLVIASHMLVLGNKSESIENAYQLAKSALQNGKALEKFRALIGAQGGDLRYVDQPELLPKAEFISVIPAPRCGYLTMINACKIGEAAVDLGAGRAKKMEKIDLAVGFEILHNVGDRVEKGEQLFTVHANDKGKMNDAVERILAAHKWSDTACERLPLFYGVVD
ncbi:MAG: thymidine phosphorylase [Anaerolineaceae bacterium]|nr:thymidine phosphorylase [Anaerolineaceae bacterium]